MEQLLEKLKDENAYYKIYTLFAIYDVAHKEESQALAIEEENGSHKDGVRPVYVILNEEEYADNETFILDDFSSRYNYDFALIKQDYLDEYVRECKICKHLVDELFVVVEMLDTVYYCSKECLHQEVSKEEYLEMYEVDCAYYTALH